MTYSAASKERFRLPIYTALETIRLGVKDLAVEAKAKDLAFEAKAKD